MVLIFFSEKKKKKCLNNSKRILGLRLSSSHESYAALDVRICVQLRSSKITNYKIVAFIGKIF